VKKLFALFAVAALAAVGCDDKKSTGGGGTKTQTRTESVLHTATNTRTLADVTVRKDVTNTVDLTVRVTPSVTKPTDKGPVVPDPNKKNGKDKD
jgi:hypothetical protein